MQGIDRYIWLVGQIITEPSVKQLLSKERGFEPSVDQEPAEPRTPDFSGYVSSEVILPRFSSHSSSDHHANLDACRQTLRTLMFL